SVTAEDGRRRTEDGRLGTEDRRGLRWVLTFLDEFCGPVLGCVVDGTGEERGGEGAAGVGGQKGVLAPLSGAGIVPAPAIGGADGEAAEVWADGLRFERQEGEVPLLRSHQVGPAVESVVRSVGGRPRLQ